MSEDREAENEPQFHSKISTFFRNDIIKEILKSQFSNTKAKITDDSVDLMAELLKILTIETAIRSVKQAKSENRTVVTLEHVETILPQLMLDFP